MDLVHACDHFQKAKHAALVICASILPVGIAMKLPVWSQDVLGAHSCMINRQTLFISATQ